MLESPLERLIEWMEFGKMSRALPPSAGDADADALPSISVLIIHSSKFCPNVLPIFEDIPAHSRNEMSYSSRSGQVGGWADSATSLSTVGIFLADIINVAPFPAPSSSLQNLRADVSTTTLQ
ncbi:hypothetical protein V6N11_073655 [Hibiscus sabdariffa]|uniref:Uncharacterized protein n=2 Tax=Hibiscus sabdariffa TaxID=183260 RepID=A0ABR2BLZ4_9ROSI